MGPRGSIHKKILVTAVFKAGYGMVYECMIHMILGSQGLIGLNWYFAATPHPDILLPWAVGVQAAQL